jgi:hypothetical protein
MAEEEVVADMVVADMAGIAANSASPVKSAKSAKAASPGKAARAVRPERALVTRDASTVMDTAGTATEFVLTGSDPGASIDAFSFNAESAAVSRRIPICRWCDPLQVFAEGE